MLGFIAPQAFRTRVEAKLRKLSKRAHTTFARHPETSNVLCTRETEDPTTGRVCQQAYYVACDRYELGDIAPFAGHSFVARIEHTEAGNLVCGVPGFDAAEFPFRTAEPVCEHCGLSRKRRDTFVLRLEDGALRQIGRNCLAEYLAVDPAAIVAQAGLFAWIQEVLETGWEDEEYWGASSAGSPATAQYVACVVASCDEHGFHPTKAEHSTRQDAMERLMPPGSTAPEHVWRAWREAQPTPAQAERAATILAWAQALEGSSDYEQNLRVAATLPDIRRNAGLLASIVAAYGRAHGQEAERKAAVPDAGHFGDIGQRLRGQAVLLGLRYFETDWGEKALVKLRTEAGHDLVWFASGRTRVSEDDIGKTFSLTGTVKRHTEYKGRKQTELSRCKLEHV